MRQSKLKLDIDVLQIQTVTMKQATCLLAFCAWRDWSLCYWHCGVKGKFHIRYQGNLRLQTMVWDCHLSWWIPCNEYSGKTVCCMRSLALNTASWKLGLNPKSSHRNQWSPKSQALTDFKTKPKTYVYVSLLILWLWNSFYCNNF